MSRDLGSSDRSACLVNLSDSDGTLSLKPDSDRLFVTLCLRSKVDLAEFLEGAGPWNGDSDAGVTDSLDGVYVLRGWMNIRTHFARGACQEFTRTRGFALECLK
jgi:hypothetical protein